MLVERVAAAIRCVRHRKPQSTRYIHRFSSIFAILHRVWHRDPQLTRYIHRFSLEIAILHRVWQRDPRNTRYIHRFSSKIAILLNAQHRNPRNTRYIHRFSLKTRFYDVNGISSYKNNAFYASFCHGLSNVSRFFAFLGRNRGMYRVFIQLVECIAFFHVF